MLHCLFLGHSLCTAESAGVVPLLHGMLSCCGDAAEAELICCTQAASRAISVAHERAANEAKSEFMSLMCHEVRTPLNGCLASAEMLLETDLQVGQQVLVSQPVEIARLAEPDPLSNLSIEHLSAILQSLAPAELVCHRIYPFWAECCSCMSSWHECSCMSPWHECSVRHKHGRCGLIFASAFVQDEQRDLAKTIRVSGSILLSTVSNFLDFFKMEAGKSLDMVRTEVDLYVRALSSPTCLSACKH